MVDFDDEGDFVRVFARHGAQHAESRGDGIATALDGESDDVFRIEIQRIRSERSPCRVFDPLIYRQNGYISGIGQSSLHQQSPHIIQGREIPVAIHPNLFNNIRPWSVEK